MAQAGIDVVLFSKIIFELVKFSARLEQQLKAG